MIRNFNGRLFGAMILVIGLFMLLPVGPGRADTSYFESHGKTPVWFYNIWDNRDADKDGAVDFKSEFYIYLRFYVRGTLWKPTVYNAKGGSAGLGSAFFQQKGVLNVTRPVIVEINAEKRTDGLWWSSFHAFAIGADGNKTGSDLLGVNKFLPAYYSAVHIAAAVPSGTTRARRKR